MDVFLIEMSNNKLFSGCIMLLTNIGSKYLAIDLPSNVEKLFMEYSILRFLVIFSIFFMATRDIKTSILLGLLFVIIIKYFINEKSTFCLIRNSDIKSDESENKKITQDEYKRAIEVINNYNSENNKR